MQDRIIAGHKGLISRQVFRAKNNNGKFVDI